MTTNLDILRDPKTATPVGIPGGFSPSTEEQLVAAKNYRMLRDVLDRAYAQAAHGKGAERHGQDMPFEDQPMQHLIQLYGPGFALGQAAKKAQEAQRLPKARAVAELLGAINYLAGTVIYLENEP